ncbi:hypothetical protein FJ417_00905 [Mesorhizobium sp. B3-1-7]|uniref:hypothetical protein n=1 Tax=Mesorhizobium sp. B3-1-7 TaxID=2589894 RepID=UPI00116B6A21|nr:hypothetical protein [Mesorhizobium sp. B3-1-7]TPI65167.1 hypothetical protein FJ417_00905 [Mesorhizobium sp. B3-1-7]
MAAMIDLIETICKAAFVPERWNSVLQKASGLSNSASAQVFDAGGGTAGSRSCRRPHFGGNGRAGAASRSKSARTYLERAFQKTGARQQSQLLAMLKTLQPLALPPAR